MEGAENAPAIEAQAVTKSYGDINALRGLDLQVESGSVFALLGPNGAGKTTAVRVLATLTEMSGGSARVAGFDIARERSQVRRRISLTGQSAALDEMQTGMENLRMMGRLSRLCATQSRQRAQQLLNEFDLVEAADRRVATYSGGMRRRLDLAASLVTRPDVVFLDEPTTGLDVRSRQAMWGTIKSLVEDGVTVLLTTQYLEEADLLADCIAVIDDGRVVAQGSPAQLKQQTSDSRVDVTLRDGRAFEQVLKLAGSRCTKANQTDRVLSLATANDAKHVRALLDEIDPTKQDIVAFEVHTPTLDDVFLALTGHRTSAGLELVDV